MFLVDIAEQRQADIERAVEQSKSARESGEALDLLLGALSQVRDAVSEAAIKDVDVNNLDEVKAALHNELNRVAGPIIKAIKGLELPEDRIESILSRIMAENKTSLEDTHDIQIVRKPKQRIEIANLRDIQFPSQFSISNLEYLGQLLEQVKAEIAGLDLSVDAPQVTVNPPEIVLPDISIPEVNLDVSSLLKALDPLKYLSNKPNKPISVRIASKDGKKFLNVLEEMKETAGRQLTAVSQGLNESSARKAFKSAINSTMGGVIGGSGSKELTNAGTAVPVSTSSVDCNYVDISVTGGLAAVGSSSAVSTTGSEVGVVLYPGNLPYRVQTNNLNSVYAAGATGSRISWTYYV